MRAVDDSGFDGECDFSPGGQRSGDFEYGGDPKRHSHRDSLRTDCGAHVVGHVVGADIHRHVACNRSCGHDDGRTGGTRDIARRKAHAEDQEERRKAGSRQLAHDVMRSLLGKAELVEILVDRQLLEARSRLGQELFSKSNIRQ
ncbi:hypothetical protein ACVI55_002210 [Sinorhizobium medicae]